MWHVHVHVHVHLNLQFYNRSALHPSASQTDRQSHVFDMKLVLLTLGLALGATSMVKSALDSSSPPTVPPG